MEVSLRSVAKRLEEEDVGALVVYDGATICGVVSERDVVFALSRGADPDEVWCGDVMSDGVLTIDARAPISEAAEFMLAKGVRHLLVSESRQVVGVVSVRDLLACLEY